MDYTNFQTFSTLPTTDIIVIGSDETDSWQTSFSFWQYLTVKEDHEGPVNLTNRKADLQGWGLFGRASFGDKDTNPYETGLAIGIGGRGIFGNRVNDEFGVGYFYNEVGISDFVESIGVQDNASGAEAYYSWAITLGAKFTLDVQWLESSLQSVDDSTVLHGRFLVTF